MKKMLLTMVMAAGVLLSPGGPAVAQETGDWFGSNVVLSNLGISREDLDRIKEAIERRSEPVVSEVSALPEDPAAGEEVRVRAKIVTPGRAYGEEVWSARINYSVDGGVTMQSAEMEKETADGNVWVGAIPGQSEGAKVVYGIQAVSAYDDAYVETLCESAAGQGCIQRQPKPDDRYGDGGYVADGVSDDMYIDGAGVGYNADKMYLEMNMKGRVSPGTFSPTEVHMYVAAWLNPEMLGDETGIEAIFKQGAAVIYSPLSFGNKCAIYYLRGGTDLQVDNEAVHCRVDGSRLMIDVDRKAARVQSGRELEFVFTTFSMMRLNPPDTDLQHITRFTRAGFVERGYSVGAGKTYSWADTE